MSNETLAQPLGPRFVEALAYACAMHRTQARKGTQIPYVAHLLAVASIALEHGATEDEAIAAVLHDVVEDQGGAPRTEEIRARFGEEVAAIVLGCSDTDVTPKPPWEARKRAYVEHVARAPRSVVLVSAADKLHNARSIVEDYRAEGEATWERFRGKREGTLWYYRALVGAYRRVGPPRLVEALDRVVCELEALAARGSV